MLPRFAVRKQALRRHLDGGLALVITPEPWLEEGHAEDLYGHCGDQRGVQAGPLRSF